ncbi:MAG TPA: SDR family oxidoreductase [Microvirga sp.]|jgi:NAD(P)-dependent dehydrogenase (short-subunit alcohol dehydrogenase family)|nr:SDR family oxidoreductase [Microvirga sp.]
MRVELDGRSALVTGAAQGIGRAIADLLAESGARVVYTDRDEAGAREAAAAAPGSHAASGSHLAYGLDVADRASIERVSRAILDETGGVDILVNNAGVGVRAADRQTVEAFPVASWDELIAVDLTGVFLMSRAIVPAMKARGFGRIVNIASVLGLVPMRLQSSYVAAKAGVVNLTKAMAIELAPGGILVNAVAPGSTATEGWRTWIRDARSEELDLHARLLSHIPLGRPAEPAEIARGALFLAAPCNTYITGHVLTIDGGWTAGFARDF